MNKENSGLSANVQPAGPLAQATPSKADPAKLVERNADGLVLDSNVSSPAASESDRPSPARAETSVHLNLIVADTSEDVERRVRELEAQLAAAQQPVHLVLNVGAAEPGVSDAALRQELSKHTGQLRGTIAKLEGAVAAGEGKVKAQLEELEQLRLANKRLEQQLGEARQQVGVTPERSRAVLREVQDKAERAELDAASQAQRIARLQHVLAHDGGERAELLEFTALEFDIGTAEDRSLRQEVQQLGQAGQQAAAELVDVQGRLAEAEAALQQRGAEVERLQQQLAEAQSAVEAAGAQVAEWRAHAEQYDRDRQQAAANVRKAEREVDLIAQENSVMFRQVNFVRTRLQSHLPQLEAAVPDIAKLARELQQWCDKEAAQRVRGGGLTPR